MESRRFCGFWGPPLATARSHGYLFWFRVPPRSVMPTPCGRSGRVFEFHSPRNHVFECRVSSFVVLNPLTFFESRVSSFAVPKHAAPRKPRCGGSRRPPQDSLHQYVLNLFYTWTPSAMLFSPRFQSSGHERAHFAIAMSVSVLSPAPYSSRSFRQGEGGASKITSCICKKRRG